MFKESSISLKIETKVYNVFRKMSFFIYRMVPLSSCLKINKRV
jgi:hypothetical protein